MSRSRGVGVVVVVVVVVVECIIFPKIVKPGARNKPSGENKFELVHYWNVFGAFTFKSTRFTGGYIKQVEGVNCTGGVCRVEPAFSGVRLTLMTNF
jgi:hypothetical protein